MSTIVEKFEHLLNICSCEDFLQCKILCNDIPIFIADYDIKEEEDFLSMQGNLINALQNKGISVLSINLYDLVIEILQNNQGDWEWVTSEDRSKEELLKELKEILPIESCIIPEIANKMSQNEGKYDILFLNGCGNIFPFLRTHTILNNLHRHINKPVIVFFPGKSISKTSPYSTFNLFNEIDEGNDYRATNIFQIRGL